MSRGKGITQRFILAELENLPEGEWAEVTKLAQAYADSISVPYTDTLLRSVRNACRRMLYEIPPILKMNWNDGKRVVQLTEHGYAKVTNPWEVKRREMADVWTRIQAEQIRAYKARQKL